MIVVCLYDATLKKILIILIKIWSFIANYIQVLLVIGVAEQKQRKHFLEISWTNTNVDAKTSLLFQFIISSLHSFTAGHKVLIRAPR